MSAENTTPTRLAVGAGTGAALVGVLIAIYMLTQFLRNSVAVIAPDLAASAGLTAADLGLLSSMFFFAFALAQLPVGVALDRFGPRKVLLVCSAALVLGCIGFAIARDTAELVGARALMGLGCSSAFMASLAIYARRFSAERFATLAGLQFGIGSIGSLFATAPLAWAAAAIGWRGSFVAVSVLALVMAALVAGVVQSEAVPRQSANGGVSLGATTTGLLAVMRTQSVWPLFLMHLVSYSSFVLFVGLWGGPYLSQVYGYGLQTRGQLLLIPALTQIAGAFLWGPTDRLFGSYKKPVLIGAGLTILSLACLGVLGTLPLPLLIVWMAAFGAFAAYTPVVIAHGKSLFTADLVGRGLTLLNVASMGGVFVAQVISGLVIDQFPMTDGRYPVDAYRAVFLLQAAFIVIAVATYIGARDPRRG